MSQPWYLPGAIKGEQTETASVAVEVSPLAGLTHRTLRAIDKCNGALTEIWRCDWKLAEKPAEQVFQSTQDPHSLNAWHCHRELTDRFFVTRGSILFAFYDARRDSPTHGQIAELRLSEQQPAIITCPPGVWHGLQNDGSVGATYLNILDRLYVYEDPDHWRLPEDTAVIPYRWKSTV